MACARNLFSLYLSPPVMYERNKKHCFFATSLYIYFYVFFSFSLSLSISISLYFSLSLSFSCSLSISVSVFFLISQLRFCFLTVHRRSKNSHEIQRSYTGLHMLACDKCVSSSASARVKRKKEGTWTCNILVVTCSKEQEPMEQISCRANALYMYTFLHTIQQIVTQTIRQKTYTYKIIK